ncbi:glycosyltransferase family 2 protein [Rhodobacter sp. Har01]|uniref:glycosyltransferase family 2 protein n=1 Tax=Rhodobacter sp. Har01 TaxID=2883999 RepID=UPI001D0867AE|nr:glycosyltransferase family 2 protein [Rhodobacter sp. Har01]MCB6178534.1 glycosyltransferase family 2 protein [Rhodobacter sp. Har01]
MTGAPVALLACMRNEGVFLLEWLAYHRVIGFDPVLVATNDCTDGSDALLDRLAAAGAVVHLANPTPPGEAPQDHGMRRALAWLSDSPAEWLAHLDSDEFLNVAHGAGRVQDLLALAGAAHVIALPWRAFGDSGLTDWPGETLPAFTACEAAPGPETTKFKSLFRFRAFAHCSDHMPTRPRIAAPRVVSSAGEPLDGAVLLGPPRARYRPLDRALAPGACVNHYAVRSRDTFLMKNDRGDGQGKTSDKYHLNGRWHRMANRNEAQDRSILRHWPATRAEIDRLRALPGVAEAETDCLADFAARKARLLIPATLRAWTKGAAA